MDIHLRHEVEDGIRKFGRTLRAPFQEMGFTFLEIVKETLGAIRGIPSATKEMFRAR